MHTVGRLARRYGLSRSALLYYDRIGLLSPSERSAAGYRIYSHADAARLEKIMVYRELGLPLGAIGRLLSHQTGSVGEVLEQRLLRINDEIANLRNQQKLILHLLKQSRQNRPARFMDKKAWTTLLQATGLNEEDMARWHREFERLAPEAHQDFLESLGIEAGEIQSIRERSQSTGPGESGASQTRKSSPESA